MSNTIRLVKCPTCKKLVKFSSDNPFRPFCSDRCKLIDLGEWAKETFRVPGDSVNPENNEDSDEKA